MSSQRWYNRAVRPLLMGLAFFLPALALLFFRLRPEEDPTLAAPLFHFYVVTFATFAAAVTSLLLSAVLQVVARPRHVLASAAFVLIGVIFFTHGLPTRGALHAGSHPAVQWSAWLTFFVGGLTFTLASFDGPAGSPGWLRPRRVIGVLGGGAAIYLAIATFAPQWLIQVNEAATPWHRVVVFWVTLVLWLLAAVRLGLTWRATGNRVDGALTFVAFWLAQASVSLHQFPLWNLSWWLYHFVLLMSFLVTVGILVAEYEQARRFRLLRYFLGVSLIFTALLALLASYLFAQYTARFLAAEIETQTAVQVETVTGNIASMLPAGISPEEARATYTAQLVILPLGVVTVYDPAGAVVYPAAPEEIQVVNPALQDSFQAALAGEMVVELYEPDNPPPGYNEEANGYVSLVMAPLRAPGSDQPVGVLAVAQDAPQLQAAILNARRAGLLIAALTMGLLFAVLLLIVRRADRIISTRAAELAQANASLQQSEQIREDLTSMIVHDLRNPLTAIITGLDLLNRADALADPVTRQRLVDNARTAGSRMESLIDDLLAVNRLESGELELDYQTVLVPDLLRERLTGFELQATTQEKRISVDCLPDLSANLDPALIGRVVDNLVNNALKYTWAGGQICISAQAADGQVYFSVRDDGEGVPDEYKEYIFDKFAQVPQNDEHSIRKGTGLGLAFCRLVVEAHGGRIWVEDANGGGSDFKFHLPKDKHKN
ncbi:MAG: ATP-binding protein [Chloroflexi bacterium]|nr:ATP-binding protein [Chloroflexota bacterium]